MSHVRAIAQKAHPIGTAEHAMARDYISKELTAQGLSPQVQECTASEISREPDRLATVHNIIGRLGGEHHSNAVLLMGHYDSMPNSPGAGNDASSVATLLETLRALKSGPQLKNDVVFLFTDGQEVASLGAKAFAAEHPLMKDVKIALNFESRGTGGPVFMVQTTDNNGWLIKKLANAVQQPLGSSIINFGYKVVNFNTDLKALQPSGIPAIEFAFFDGSASSHTFNDNVQNFDERSLQHSGSYALSLTRELGNSDLTITQEKDRVYFDLLSLVLVHYPSWLSAPVAIFIVLLFSGVVAIGFRRKLLTLRGVALGVVALFASMTCIALVVSLLNPIIRTIFSKTNAGNSGDDIILLGFAALTITIVSGIYKWFARKASIHDLSIGGQFWWAILLIVASFAFRSGSYLLAWPLLFSVLQLGLLFRLDRTRLGSPGYYGLVALCTAPAIILVVPTIYTFHIGLGLSQVSWLMVLLTLLLGLLIPHVNYLASSVTKKWGLIYATSGALGITLLGAGILNHALVREIPKSNSIMYLMNADTGKAYWGSTDETPDQWTSQFFQSNTSLGKDADLFDFAEDFIVSPAPIRPLLPPNITQIEEIKKDGFRELRLRVTSPRKAAWIEISTKENESILSASVNGKGFKPRQNKLSMRYYNLPLDGIELKMVMNSTEPVGVRVVDYTYGIANSAGIPIKERPQDIMPSSSMAWRQDSVAIGKTYTF